MEIYFWSPRRVRLIGAVGAEQTLPDVNPVWDILKLGYSHKISKNWKVHFGAFFFNLRFSKKTPFFTYKIPVFSKPVTGIALKMRKSGPRSKIRSRNMFG